jgi:hypothetical protein
MQVHGRDDSHEHVIGSETNRMITEERIQLPQLSKFVAVTVQFKALILSLYQQPAKARTLVKQVKRMLLFCCPSQIDSSHTQICADC